MVITETKRNPRVIREPMHKWPNEWCGLIRAILEMGQNLARCGTNVVRVCVRMAEVVCGGTECVYTVRVRVPLCTTV